MTGTSSSSGGSSKAKEATSAKKPEGRSGSVAVTAEDLALREDICYQIFGDVGPLIRDFSCAWDHKVVMHGRMYVTERRLCFYANFFGLEAKMSLRHDDIARCSKGNSAIFIPNVIVVQDKSGKDFVFRAFWERDECHSLLEKLRVEADEFRVRAEKVRTRVEELSAQTGQEVIGDGNELSAITAPPPPEKAPGSGFGASGAGEEDPAGFHADDDEHGSVGAESLQEDPPTTPLRDYFKPLSPRQRVAENGPSILPREDSCSPSEASSCRADVGSSESTPPPPLAVSTRPSSSMPPPPQRQYSGGSSASLPSSPNASSAAAAAAAAGRGRSYSMTPVDGDGGGGLVRAVTTGGIAPPRPAKLGLAVLGADHDVPSPQPPPLFLNGDGIGGAHGRLQLQQQQQQHQQKQQPRPSPRGTAVITGAGRAGWGSPLPGVNTPNGHYGSGGGTRVTDTRGSVGSTTGSADARGEEEGGVGDRGKGALQQQQQKEEEEEEGRQQGSGGKARLVRRGSNLWNMMMGGRAGAGEEDPAADRKAMEEAIKTGGDNHSEVATAEFGVSVKEFYERFFADDAPYSLPDFHISRGDWEVDADEWQQTVEEAQGVTGVKEAAKGGGGGGTKAGSTGGVGVTRAIRFKTPLHITFMSSPGQVRTLKRQRCRFFGRQGCVVETQTTVEDRIPLSDNFHVEDRWIIRPAAASKDGQRSCTATVTWRCVWHKFTVIKGLIEGKCRADVRSFNIAFLEGMQEHLVESKVPMSGGLNRRSSFRDSLLSASGGAGGGGGRRASRDRSFSGRSLLSSFAGSDAGGGVSLSALGVEDRPRGFDRLLPAIRVFSIFFILYISLFWVRHQMRDGGDWRRGTAGGFTGSRDELMRLYGEWGRSSLALLDVREETQRLAAELLQFDPRGRSGPPSGKDKGTESRRLEGEAVERLLREIEEKVTGMSKRADSALATLDVTASQIRDAMACLPGTNAAAAADEQGCVPCGGAREHAYVAQALDPSNLPDHKLAQNQLPTQNNQDLYCAAKTGNLGGLKAALTAGGNPNWYNKSEDGATALHQAASGGHVACIELLLKNGSVIDERLLTNNNSPLHLACGNGHLEAVKVLVAASSEVNAGNTYGNSPIHSALIGGHRSIVELLLEKGADVTWTNNKGSSLFHFLGYSSSMAAADKKALSLKLIEAGLNIDVKDEDGMTPLHVMGQSGDKEMATFLFENGADITIRDVNGKTPLQWAQLNKHTEVGSLLAGAKKDTAGAKSNKTGGTGSGGTKGRKAGAG
eukprot:g11848.t1